MPNTTSQLPKGINIMSVSNMALWIFHLKPKQTCKHWSLFPSATVIAWAGIDSILHPHFLATVMSRKLCVLPFPIRICRGVLPYNPVILMVWKLLQPKKACTEICGCSSSSIPGISMRKSCVFLMLHLCPLS